MQLIGVEIEGYHRIGKSVSIRLMDSLVVVVGQNEAGKTLFLKALEEFNSNDEVAERDRTCRLDTATKIKATFKLDENDSSALNDVDSEGKIK